jgi:hypothetical protein
MNISTFFKLVKAPLRNTRWSWGAVRADGSVVLRVWQQDISNGEVQVQFQEQHGPGGAERNAHVSSVTTKGVYCVACVGDHISGIQSFDKRELWYGNELRTDEQGNIFLKLLHRVSVGELL